MQAVESLLDNGASTEQHQRLCYALIWMMLEVFDITERDTCLRRRGVYEKKSFLLLRRRRDSSQASKPTGAGI